MSTNLPTVAEAQAALAETVRLYSLAIASQRSLEASARAFEARAYRVSCEASREREAAREAAHATDDARAALGRADQIVDDAYGLEADADHDVCPGCKEEETVTHE